MAGESYLIPTEQVVTTVFFDGEGLTEHTSVGKVGVESTIRAITELFPRPTPDEVNDAFENLHNDPGYQKITAQIEGLSKYKHAKRERLERQRARIMGHALSSLVRELPEIVSVEREFID